MDSLFEPSGAQYRYKPGDAPVMGGFYAYRQYANREFNKIAEAFGAIADTMERLDRDMPLPAYCSLWGNGNMAIGTGWTRFPTDTAEVAPVRMKAAAGAIRPDAPGDFLLCFMAAMEHPEITTATPFKVALETVGGSIVGRQYSFAFTEGATLTTVAISQIISLPDVSVPFQMVGGSAPHDTGANVLSAHFLLSQVGRHG